MKEELPKRIPNTVVEIPDGYELSAYFEENGKLNLIWARSIDYSALFAGGSSHLT